MSPRCPLKANGPTQYIELHVPLFTGKAGPGDNKKGDIYCSLQQCDVPCQITAQVGRRAPPCREEDETLSGARGDDALTGMNTHTLKRVFHVIVPKDQRLAVTVEVPFAEIRAPRNVFFFFLDFC